MSFPRPSCKTDVRIPVTEVFVASNSDSSEWISIKLSIGSEQGKLFDFGLILAKHKSNLLSARPCTDTGTLVYSALDTATGRRSNLWPAAITCVHKNCKIAKCPTFAKGVFSDAVEPFYSSGALCCFEVLRCSVCKSRPAML